MISYTKTPVQELKGQLFEQNGIRLVVKREDLNHPAVSGNKWWKLKYNLEKAKADGHHTLLTFGGAYSNHIYAISAAAREMGLSSIGVIRGEEVRPNNNNTLAFAEWCGMRLHFVTRESYRNKADNAFIKNLEDLFGKFYLIPEGGTNELAIQGVREFGSTLLEDIEFDYLCLPVGTGGTIAGLIQALDERKSIIGFSVLKGGQFLNDDIRKWVGDSFSRWNLVQDYHFGGYAKVTSELTDFIKEMEISYQLPLDEVYTGKMFFGILDLIRKGFFEKGSTILALHTGGLQGKII